MEGLKVQCPNCKHIRHITTKHYAPDATPRGNFLELIDPWKKWKWDCYNDEGRSSASVPPALMNCPGCASPLVINGRLCIVSSKEPIEPIVPKEQDAHIDAVIDEPPKNICKHCSKECKSYAGLKAHMRVHEKNN